MTYKELGKVLKRKDNTLNYLCLDRSVNIVSSSFLTSLINLKEISISQCDCKEFWYCFAIAEFPNLECLDIYRLSYFKELAMLIEKTKGNISYVNIYTENENAKNTGMLIKAITNHCPNIKELTTYLEPKDFIHVKLLLLNCRYLEYIFFDSLIFHVNGNDNVGDKLLDIIAKFSPNSLTKIYISGSWEYSIYALEQFFESCRERTLLEFRFTAFYDELTKDYEAVVEKYVKEGVILSFSR